MGRTSFHENGKERKNNRFIFEKIFPLFQTFAPLCMLKSRYTIKELKW
jgi:hypothetical protein